MYIYGEKRSKTTFSNVLVRTKTVSSTAFLVKAMLLEMALIQAVEKKQEDIVAMNAAKHFATTQALFIMTFAKIRTLSN